MQHPRWITLPLALPVTVLLLVASGFARIVWLATHGWIASHAIQHFVAAAAIWPVLVAMTAAPGGGHNRRAPVAHAA